MFEGLFLGGFVCFLNQASFYACLDFWNILYEAANSGTNNSSEQQ